jgi:xanthine dehydrogenase molybdenum-binding subunit
LGVVVAADSEQICDEALKLVEVEWDEKSFVIDWDNAPEDRILVDQVTGQFGDDIDGGFAEADRIIELKWKRWNTTWAGTEGVVATAQWRGDHYLDCWNHSQIPHQCVQALSELWPMARIHIHAPFHGSQFGSLNWGAYYSHWSMLACILAKITQRPVQHLYGGHSSHFDGGSQSVGTFEFKVGCKEDGTITAVDYHTTSAPVAWSPFGGPGGLWIEENTKIPQLRLHTTTVRVNHGKHPCWKHGGGYTTLTIVPFEMVASELGMNPIDVMIKNDGTYGHDRAWMENYMDETGFDSSRDSLKECIDACDQTVDMRNKWHPPGEGILPNGKYHGMGFAFSGAWTHVLGDKGGSYVGLGLRPDGTMSIQALRGDQGTGFQGGCVRVAADEMGMKYEDVDWQGIHDEQYFHAHDEGCSGGTISISMAISKAARKLKQRVLETATYDEPKLVWFGHGSRGTTPSLFPDLTPEEMDIADSVVFEKANPDNNAPIGAVVDTVNNWGWGNEEGQPLFEWDWCRNTDPPLDPEEFEHGYPCLTRLVSMMEIEIDPETGMIEVVKGAAANDMGKAFDPDALDQQIFGGFMMGYSRSGLEEQVYDPQTGVQLTDNLIGYPIAVMNDAAHADAYRIETGGGYGPYGATGCGESPCAIAINLIPTAVHNALGVWVDTPPTPMRILKALGKA